MAILKGAMYANLGIVVYAALGVLVALVWHPFTLRRGGFELTADISLGVIGAGAGGILSAFFDVQKRIMIVFPLGVLLAVGGALSLLMMARWISRIPADA